MHRNRDATPKRFASPDYFGVVDPRCEQFLRQTFRLAAEDEKIAALKFCVVISALRFSRQKKIARARLVCPLQSVERIPQLQIDFVPIIETGPFELAIIQGKAQRLDQMQCRLRRQTKPANVASIRRNFRFNQNDVEHFPHLNPLPAGEEKKGQLVIRFLSPAGRDARAKRGSEGTKKELLVAQEGRKKRI